MDQQISMSGSRQMFSLIVFLSCCNCQRLRQAIKRMWTLDFLGALFTEYLATFILIVMGLGSTINPEEVGLLATDRILISLCFGLSITILVHFFGPISGGHMNPAVTAAMVVTRKLSPAKALFYILAQCLGAVTGAEVLYFITPPAQRGSLGVTMINSDIHVAYGFVVEIIITFMLVLTFLANCGPKRTDLKGSASFAIGTAVAIGHLFAIPYTGASMNPARSFGPAMVTMNFQDHWVFWAGPILGGLLAAILYMLLPNLETTQRGREVEDAEQTPMSGSGQKVALRVFLSCCNCQRLRQAIKRMWTLDFLGALFAEYLATFILIVMGLGSTINPGKGSLLATDRILISLCFGLSITILVQCFGPISGGHMNPAVTAAMVVTRKLSPAKALFYILAQCLGAVTGAEVLYFIVPPAQRGSLGVTMINSDIHVAYGFVVEIIITFMLVLTFLVNCDPKRTDLKGSASFAIGTAVAIGHLFAIPYTGASMNPARSFGPAMVTMNFQDHWVFWAGPILGGLLAAILYMLLPNLETTQRGREVEDAEQTPMSGSGQIVALRVFLSCCNCQRLRKANKRMWILDFLGALFAEYLATFILIVMGLGSTINWAADKGSLLPTDRILISLCFGLSITILVQCFGPISGGHMNPAVTAAMVVTRKLSPAKALFYILAQCLGAVTGAEVLYFIVPPAQRGSLGVTMINSDIHVAYGFVVEIIITFVLVLTFLANCGPKRTDLKGSASFAIGIVVVIFHLFAIPYTGASMNPARSFGPAMVTMNFQDQWVFWAGPILGGLLAAILYMRLPNLETTQRGREVKAALEEVPMEGIQIGDVVPSLSGTGSRDQPFQCHLSQIYTPPLPTPNSELKPDYVEMI